jgi:cobaltochelatase CobN
VPRRQAEKIARYVEDLYRRIKGSDEIGGLLKVLDAGYLEPRVAGDPLRTPEAFPTGSHGYAFDPRLIPSMSAYQRGVMIARETLERYRRRYGRYPETVAVVLWGFETAGTRGETIGQILEYIGVKLERKGPWNWDLKPIPLNELGHPRIDVVVTICGIFRDTFPHLIELLSRAFKLVANLNEPPEVNYVRKHYLEAKEAGSALAAARIFGPKPGAYNTRLTEMIETSSWSTEDELAVTYISDMGYAYTDATHGVEAKELFSKLLSKVDMVTQIRYSHEYDIVDLDHYYEFLGGLSKAVERVRGSRPETLWVDTTLEKPKVKDVGEAITEALYTRLLNPRWINAMLSHGYDGAREIAERVEYLLGLAATTGAVPDWAWSRIADRYIRDDRIRNTIARENREALLEIARRLLEAARRGYWGASRRELEEIEDLISKIGEDGEDTGS